MTTIFNDGPELVSTDYWHSKYADRGLLYLSCNAGTWRLLVPRVAEGLVDEMRTAASVFIERSTTDSRLWDVVFDDGTPTPFVASIDKRQADRAMTPGRCRLAVWTERGKVLDLPCEVRP